MSHKHSYQYIVSQFKVNNCVLLSKTYKNNKQRLDYICSCSNKSTISYAEFQSGQRCKYCGYKKLAINMTYSYEHVKSYFEQQNCVLVSIKYIGAHQKLKYVCSCNNKSEITFNNFQNGTRCRNCGIIKRKQTNLEKYGVEYVSQDPNIFDKQQKSGYKRKPVITPSGKTIHLQGYEPQAYNKLLEQYSEDEINHIIKDIPEIWYLGEDNKTHRYYPDFYIPKDNLIIEVKSEHYYKKDLLKNKLKQQACLDSGYEFEFIIIVV